VSLTSSFKAAIFDFDYTLADSSEGVVECVNYALRGVGLPEANADEIRSTIGLPLPEILVRLAGRENSYMRDEYVALFVEKADEVIADSTEVFDFVPDVMSYLKERDYTLGIMSTKFRHRIETILKREGLLHFFDVIVGGEDVSRHKPDPESLNLTIRKLGLPREELIYVGDSVTDAKTAKRSGVNFVAVLSGVTPRDAFDAYPRYAILASIQGLRGVL
jgi:phosphoglycolate phosphatase